MKCVHVYSVESPRYMHTAACKYVLYVVLRRQTRVIAVSPSDINNNRGHRLVDGGKIIRIHQTVCVIRLVDGRDPSS